MAGSDPTALGRQVGNAGDVAEGPLRAENSLVVERYGLRADRHPDYHPSLGISGEQPFP